MASGIALPPRPYTTVRKRETSRLAVVGLRLGLILFSVLLPFVALEIGFRILGPFLPGEYTLGSDSEFDPVLGWRNRPGYSGGVRTSEFAVRTQINSRGLRDEEIPYQKPPGGLRVLALGDSFLAANHVSLEQAMTKQLQGLLRASQPTRPVDVVNAGVAGYGTSQEYLYLDTEGYKYAPDVVLVVVFLGNDLMDNVRTATQGRQDRPVFKVDGDDRLVQSAWPQGNPARPSWDEYLARHSTVYNFLQTGILRKLDPAANQTGEAGGDPGQDLQIYERRQSTRIKRAWEVTEALLGAIGQRSLGLGARTVIVGAPSARQLDPARFAEAAAKQGDPAEYDVDLPDKQLGQVAAKLGLPYLDLLPALRRASADGSEVFYPKNRHWTPAGQAAVARAIQQFLAERKLVGG